MTKRTAGQYARAERDYYATPEKAVLKLLPRISGIERFAEPMCGDGAIIRVLERLGWECGFASDIEPQGEMSGRAVTLDVLRTDLAHFKGCDAIISNPPWPWPSYMRSGHPEGTPTLQIIEHLMRFKPTWLILSADFMHNGYFRDLWPYCREIVSAGRVKWMAGTKNTGFDNAAWYHFDGSKTGPGPRFFPNEEGEITYHPSIEGIL